MACKGCKKRAKKFKELVRIKMQEVELDRDTIHWMKVCKHGVPHGFYCGSCKKVISIPEDAKIKPPEKQEDN